MYRYGSDKRLYHVAETLRALGHDVHFGGMEVSGLESEDDHLRVKALGARLYRYVGIIMFYRLSKQAHE